MIPGAAVILPYHQEAAGAEEVEREEEEEAAGAAEEGEEGGGEEEEEGREGEEEGLRPLRDRRRVLRGRDKKCRCASGSNCGPICPKLSTINFWIALLPHVGPALVAPSSPPFFFCNKIHRLILTGGLRFSQQWVEYRLRTVYEAKGEAEERRKLFDDDKNIVQEAEVRK